ncbi:hypothetical protein COCSADRAFT_157824 [Bipolaris sorokiniana ND90Pr]|uniref:Glycoside hydrolase family 2 protein n=1 Tax=Cochliobolus sativus (strain ND90Pr / ATCC 201652) TaxID=665912 RepID=M2SYP3_COCSN|nr:uncharacterized protein COCSADRAFT_157824 [Bipolaris sorokiniana ND90Pr]EMD67440.1 hypothetical protein COCSADRAFT_157824 [Bipolaris sorokiniana ND90Pr]
MTAQFSNPPNQYRPKFRYWLPDASVTHDSVQNDVRQIAAVGGGGLEFLPFYNYGLGPALTDWSIYGFGTDAFNKLFQAALDTASTLRLAFDFALGPNQGAGVPSEVETPGLAKTLVYGSTKIESGANFSGEIPEPVVNYNFLPGFMNPPEPWGSNELLAVVAGRIASEGGFADGPYGSKIPYTFLDHDSLVELTNITNHGTLTWTAPDGNGTWVLFAVYERYTNQRTCVSIANATTALGNGSWVVDHWSVSGAKKTTDFWDQHILSVPEIARLVGEVMSYAWEDSMEIQAALPWTPNLSSRFEQLHGYSINKYLPILFHGTNAWQALWPAYNMTYTVGEYFTDGGPYVQDYKLALSEGYVNYIDHYAKWATSKGLQLSNQPSYNQPVDMAEAIPHVQVPELESLGLEEDIDLYRQFAGPAHLSGRNVISTEIGAINGAAYSLRVPKLKNLFDQSYAAGVNTMVVHGYAYSGEYFKTTWPGYTPFQYSYTEMWNQRQPAWQHLDDLFTYSARNSLIMQSGTPKVDLALYYYQAPYKFADLYSTSDANAYGYTYEYLGPKNLVSEHAVVVDGVLAPEGPAYKALLIYNQTKITLDASAALLEFAQNGLPIYIVGTVPNTTIGSTGQEQVSANINELLQYKDVRVFDAKDFSTSKLAADGVHARAQVDGTTTASDLFTFWTADVGSRSEYVYLYNQGVIGVFNITFNVGKDLVPYILDPWTGSEISSAVFERSSSSVRMAIQLQSHQTTIVAFKAAASARREKNVVNHSSNVKNVYFTEDNHLEALISDSLPASLCLSNGKNINLPEVNTQTLVVTTLGPWNLTVQAYGPMLDHTTVDSNITTINVGMLPQLAPWTKIPGIEHVSGIGTYSTNFTISTDNSTSIMVDFGPVLHTIKAWLNGKQVPAIDPTNSIVEISKLVKSGNNVMKVEVTTSLFNAVKENIDNVLSIGVGPTNKTVYTSQDWHEFGLVGPVQLRPYWKVRVELS